LISGIKGGKGTEGVGKRVSKTIFGMKGEKRQEVGEKYEMRSLITCTLHQV
jgi:hypothetical protein